MTHPLPPVRTRCEQCGAPVVIHTNQDLTAVGDAAVKAASPRIQANTLRRVANGLQNEINAGNDVADLPMLVAKLREYADITDPRLDEIEQYLLGEAPEA